MANTNQSKPAANCELLARCPFCGAPLTVGHNIEEAVGSVSGLYKLSHTCFAHIHGNYLAVGKIEFLGRSKKEVAEFWNRRAAK